MMKLTDPEILTALKSGGPAVHKIMDYVYMKSRKKIIGHVMKNGGSKEDGQDVLQETVSSFYTNIINNKFRGESDISGYLFGIARNKWLKMVNRRNRVSNTSNVDFVGESQTEEESSIEVLKQIDVVLKKMNIDCREVLVHAFYYNYSAAELSRKFRFKNEQVARNKKSKCLKRLRAMMDKIKK